MMGWQPIEAAPKDGSDVLVCEASGDMSIAHFLTWDGNGAGWVGLCRGEDASCDRDGYPVVLYPTHWMPLPAPPT
jgi:hypothetical protein